MTTRDPRHGATTSAPDRLSVSTTGPGRAGEPTLGRLVGRLGEDLSRLMRAEIALAKAEAKEEAAHAGRGAGLLAGAGMAAQLALVFVSLAAVLGLSVWMPLGWAALIVGAAWALVGAVLAVRGRSHLRRGTSPLQQTVESVKEDVRWAKRPLG